jgi:DNA relaxase NicK
MSGKEYKPDSPNMLESDFDQGQGLHSESSECRNPLRVIRGLDQHTYKNVANQRPQILGDTALHWVRGSVPQEHRFAVKDYLSHWFGDDIERRKYGLYFYDRSMVWLNGVAIYYHSSPTKAKNTEGLITVDIPGNAIDGFGSYQMAVLVKGLSAFGFKAARIDMFYDDYTRLITPGALYSTIHAVDHQDKVTKHDFTGFRKISYHRSADHDKLMSDMVSFGNRGNRGSGKYLRVYDKLLESKGENSAIRYELELSGEIAKQACTNICDCSSSAKKLSKLITSLIGGCIDFRKSSEKPNATNLKRLERYEFWQILLSRFDEPIFLKKPVKPKTIEKAIDYVEHQVAPGLQMLRKVWGDDKFNLWMSDLSSGTNRLPTCERRREAEAFGRHVESLVACRLAAEHLTAPLLHWLEGLPFKVLGRLEQWGVIAPERVSLARPLTDHITDFEQSLKAKGRTAKHIRETVSGIREICTKCSFSSWRDITASKVDYYLGQRREDRVSMVDGQEKCVRGISARTYNHKLKAF